VTHWPEGQGKCADPWSEDRLEYKPCNVQACPEKMTCDKKLDIVLVIDGSGSLGQKGFNASIKAAEQFVDAFDVRNHQANIAVIVYSGPYNRDARSKCLEASGPVDIAKDCKVKAVVPLGSPQSKDMAQVKKAIKSLTWPRGYTLTSLALSLAGRQLDLGRQNTKGIVVVFTDGMLQSKRRTAAASKKLRLTARVLWVPVEYPKWEEVFGKLATRRPEENIVPVENFDELRKPAVVKHILADICPHTLPR